MGHVFFGHICSLDCMIEYVGIFPHSSEPRDFEQLHLRPSALNYTFYLSMPSGFPDSGALTVKYAQ